MEMYGEMLVRACLEERLKVTDRHLARFLRGECYRALEEIREILRDGSLDDAACFAKIEAVVRVYERRGVSCGGRHDFS